VRAVGIATGLVVSATLLGVGEAQERGIAARHQTRGSIAGARRERHVVIAETTRRILGDLFELYPLAPSSLKGFAEPVLRGE